jgi:two-component system sensor histidine kinase PilS (NtrC family)
MDFSSLVNRTRSAITIDELLRNQLLWMLLLRIILYTLILALSYIFRGSQIDIIKLPANLLLLLLFVVYLTTIFSGFLLLVFRGNLRQFGFFQSLLDTVFVSLFVFFSGCSGSVFATVYFFPIVAGGLILPRKGGLVAAAAATLQYGAILFLESQGLIPSYLHQYVNISSSDPFEILNRFSVHGLTFFLAAVLSALFGRRLQKTETALTDSIRNFDRLTNLYKQIFDNISTGIITIDGDTVITSANNSVKKITGFNPEDLTGSRLSNFFPDFEIDEERTRLTADFKKQDGEKVRIGYSSMILHQSAAEQRSMKPAHKIITLQDISDIEKLERQVRQAEKLAAIGMMSASIAHDFRNPLTAISGSAQVLANEFSRNYHEHRANYELANIIMRESNRLNSTIADFLKFSRPENANCQWFSLQGCLDEVLEVLKADPNWPENARVVCNFQKTLDIWADEKQMFFVFSQLIQNGLAFCPKGKETIEVDCSETTGPEGQEFVTISIRDNGPGIGEVEKMQVFEPFFTTRADGTGLGLAIVEQTIKEHQGEIKITDGPDGGAVFSITLPLPG